MTTNPGKQLFAIPATISVLYRGAGLDGWLSPLPNGLGPIAASASGLNLRTLVPYDRERIIGHAEPGAS